MIAAARSQGLLALSRNTGATSALFEQCQRFHWTGRSRRPRRGPQRPNKFRKPTVDIAKSMATNPSEMDNSALVTLAAIGNKKACIEVLKRHIMCKDNISYDDACVVFDKIAAKNREGMTAASLPYQIGIATAIGGALVSVPLVFHLGTVEWFNEAYVTADVPEPKDLETWLECGSWSWNWMEPVLGQISFFLLCLQFSRAQLENLGVRPYTSKMKRMRATSLAAAFPQYDTKLVMNYSESVDLFDD